jgi:hypothetical protein
MEMRIDEGRRNEPPRRVDGLARFRRDMGLDRDDAPVARADVDGAAAVGERGGAD